MILVLVVREKSTKIAAESEINKGAARILQIIKNLA